MNKILTQISCEIYKVLLFPKNSPTLQVFLTCGGHFFGTLQHRRAVGGQLYRLSPRLGQQHLIPRGHRQLPLLPGEILQKQPAPALLLPYTGLHPRGRQLGQGLLQPISPASPW